MATTANNEPEVLSTECLEEIGENRKIVLKTFIDGTLGVYHYDLADKRNNKFVKLPPQAESIYKNQYIAWHHVFDEKVFSKDKARLIGLKEVAEHRRLAFPANFNCYEADMDAKTFCENIEKKFKSGDTTILVRTDTFDAFNDFSVSVVLFHEGTLKDYFDLDEIIEVYSRFKHDLEPFRSSLEALFDAPIAKFAHEHLYTEGEGFSFNIYRCSPLHLVVRGLLLGLPPEMTAIAELGR